MQFRTFFRVSLLLVLVTLLHFTDIVRSSIAAQDAHLESPNPILFVTQIPIPADFTTIGSVFGNHQATMQDVGRGGDLWIRYADGTLKNLTAAAGYGNPGFQGNTAIAVRDPSVHWDGSKAIFSMVVGAPEEQYLWETYYWQLYEISGLAFNDTPVISKVPNQPQTSNNISPIYGTDGRVIFTSDRPRNGAEHLYPQLDEYELAPTNTGLWSLDPSSGNLILLDHSPSGDFTPTLDSFGRVIFTRWDHLQRDQQADADAHYGTGQSCGGGTFYGTFNYSDESVDASYDLDERTEVFPEPRACREDLLAGTNLVGHTFNHFFPWQINEDGTEAETLNHIGRQKLHSYLNRSINDDPNVVEYYGQYPRFNPNPILNWLQIKEDPLNPGIYYGTNAPEFTTHAAGQITSLSAAPTVNGDEMRMEYITHPDTSGPSDGPSQDHSGLYREPLPLADGTLLAVHTSETRRDRNEGTRGFPVSRYDFRLKRLALGGNGYWVADQPLTSGISKTVSYWDPDVLVTYSGELWELNPVEVRSRPVPTAAEPVLPAPEQTMFDQAGVSVAELRSYLQAYDLALVVSRNVTTRDDLDLQQPYNLRVPGGTETIGAAGKVYDVAYLQFFQADQLRGFTGCCDTTPNPGRRVLAQPMHDPAVLASNPPSPEGPPGSVVLGLDGSQAAFVPARRAMTWQLTDNAGAGVVRERYWLTFQPGEIRVCTSCHGLNEYDQAGQISPTNAPQALYDLLLHWKSNRAPQVRDDTEIDIQYDGWRGEADITALGGGYRAASDFLDWLASRTTSPATAVDLLVCRGPELGLAWVFLDGLFRGLLDFYAPAPVCNDPVQFGGLTAARHTMVVVATGQKNPLSSGTEVRVDGFEVNGLPVDDSNPEVIYESWMGLSLPQALNGSFRWTARPDASIRFTTQGTRFTWITARCPACGQAEVTVDGEVVAFVDAYSPDWQFQYYQVINGLSPGTHRVEIVTSDTRNGASSGNLVVFDGFSMP